MRTPICKVLSIVAMAMTALLSSAPASAGLITTPAQTKNFSFGSLTGSPITLSFDGFNASLGTLNSVHLAWTISNTLNNALINTNSTPSSVGTPVPVAATSTTTLTGTGIATLLSGTNNLTTPGFVGSVPGNNAVTTVGTASQSGVPGSTCISNDASCGAGNTDLSAYNGGINLFNISVSNFGNQGGSVPAGVFSGNNGTANGAVSIFYDYTAASVPNPGTLALLGLGLLGMSGVRRKVMR